MDSISDQDDWKATLASMAKLRFSEEDTRNVIEVLMLVLTLGNVKFKEGDKQQVRGKGKEGHRHNINTRST